MRIDSRAVEMDRALKEALTMTYQKLFQKMMDEQSKFMPTIQQLGQEGKLPEDFAKAVRGIEAWDQEADMKLGDAEAPALAPSTDSVSMFSNALFTYKGMFSEKEQEAIQLYREYAEEMFHLINEANVQPA